MRVDEQGLGRINAADGLLRLLAVARLNPRRILLLLILLCGLVLLYVYAPHFFKLRNGINILVQASTIGILAIGMTLVLIGGGIDLSMPANMAFSAILGAMFMRAGGDPVLASLLIVAVAGAVGLFNGVAIAYLGMIPFVVTLASMTMLAGISVWITRSVSVSVTSESFFDVLLAHVARIPVSVGVWVAIALFATLVMSRTRYGRWLTIIGANLDAARAARIPTRAILCLTYMIAGLLAGITAVLLTARLGAASASMGNNGVVLDVISACVIGGVSIYGGVGRPINAFVGALLITLIANSLNMLGISYYFSLIIKGSVIIIFIYLDGLNKRSNS